MAFDFGKLMQFLLVCGVVTLCILFGLTVKKWYDTPSERPSWIITIINMVYPVTYKKLTGMAPYMDSNVSSVTTTVALKDCASNCTNAADCLGFVYSDNNCKSIKTDFGKLIMLVDSKDTYVKSTLNLPKWGYIKQADGKDYAFGSNVTSQHLGSIIASKDPTYLSNVCTQQFTSNCVGFSINTSTSNAWLINDTSNVATTSNVQSYLLTYVPTYSFSDVKSF